MAPARFPGEPRRRSQEGATAFETIVVSMIVGVLIVVVFSYFQMMIKLSEEAALQSELLNIRTSVQLFYYMNRRLPDSLEELVQAEYVAPDAEFSLKMSGGSLQVNTPFTRGFLEPRSIDARGRILDPFGEPYRYDPATGLVSVGDPGYRNW